MSLTNRRVTTNDLETLKQFLQQNKLPHDDIRLDGNEFFFFYDGDELAGSGGLESYGDHGLLRSVAVSQEFRSSGLGREIVQNLLNRAKERQLHSVSLLTETAPVFFEKLGFVKQSRDSAAKEIMLSSEFSSVCPVSAVLMSLDLTRRPG